MNEKPARKLTRKRIRMQGVRFERQQEQELWAKLGGAELVEELSQSRKPLTFKPFANIAARV